MKYLVLLLALAACDNPHRRTIQDLKDQVRKDINQLNRDAPSCFELAKCMGKEGKLIENPSYHVNYHIDHHRQVYYPAHCRVGEQIVAMEDIQIALVTCRQVNCKEKCK